MKERKGMRFEDAHERENKRREKKNKKANMRYKRETTEDEIPLLCTQKSTFRVPAIDPGYPRYPSIREQAQNK